MNRVTAEMDEPFVVFLIGMRINSYWKLHEWLPVAVAMPRMIRELEATDDSGLLSYETTVTRRTILMVQYWDSFEKLREYARDGQQAHLPAWVDYNRSAGQDGAVGVFQETYRVDPDDTESVYNNMPAFGLGKAGRVDLPRENTRLPVSDWGSSTTSQQSPRRAGSIVTRPIHDRPNK